MNLDDVTRMYFLIDDKMKDLEEAHKKRIDELKAKQDQLRKAVQKHFTETGQRNAATEHGTAFASKKDSVRVANKSEFLEFLLQEVERCGIDGLYLAQVSAAKNNVKEWMEQNNDELPPGLNYEVWEEIKFRRPTKK